MFALHALHMNKVSEGSKNQTQLKIISWNVVYYAGTSLKEKETSNAWEIIVSAWERKI